MKTFLNKYSATELLKKYFPIVSIILLTFLLMIFFRHNKNHFNRLIEESKNNLVSFYTRNLKPLFVSTEITNEDMFNFALYRTLPIDKDKKKLLIVSGEDNNKQTIEVKDATYVPYTDNYKRFVDYLGLDSTQKLGVDSILGAYKKEIYLSILKSDKDAIAVSPYLSNLQKAILADLIAYSEKVNSAKIYNIFQINDKSLNVHKLTSFATLAKGVTNKEFILITPDTVFQTKCEIDANVLNKLPNIDLNRNLAAGDIKNNIRIKVDFNSQVNQRSNKNEVMVPKIFHKVDSSLVKVTVPLPKIPKVNYTHIDDSVIVKLEKATDKLKMFSVQWRPDTKDNFIRKERKGTRNFKNNEPIQFHFNFDPEAFSEHVIKFSHGKFRDVDKLGFKTDSLARYIEKTISDSLKFLDKLNLENNFSKKKRIIGTEKNIIK